MKETFKAQLLEWAENTCNFYNSEYKSDFYTQSDLTKVEDSGIELMIIGINPGSSQYTPERDKTPEELLSGNPNFNIEVDWKLWRGIKNILRIAELLDLISNESHFVFTNATFYATKKENELEASCFKEIHKESVKYTKELISILKPKHIICLGGKNCTNILDIETSPLIQDSWKQTLIGFGQIILENCSIPVYSIKHTGGATWANEEMELVGKVFKQSFNLDTQNLNNMCFNTLVLHDLEEYKRRKEERISRKNEDKLRFQYIYTSLYNFCAYDMNLEGNGQSRDWAKFKLMEQKADLQIVCQNKTREIRVFVDPAFSNIIPITATSDFKHIVTKTGVGYYCLKLSPSGCTDGMISTIKSVINKILDALKKRDE